MNFNGELISLRAVEKSDVDLLYRWENDARMWATCSAVAPYSKYALEQYVESANDLFGLGQARFMIDSNETRRTVGCVDLIDFQPRFSRAEVAIFIEKEYQGLGYAKESLKIAKDYAFHILHLHQLYAYVGELNEVSQNLFQSVGFKKQCVLKDWTNYDSRWEDVGLFTLLNE